MIRARFRVPASVVPLAPSLQDSAALLPSYFFPAFGPLVNVHTGIFRLSLPLSLSSVSLSRPPLPLPDVRTLEERRREKRREREVGAMASVFGLRLAPTYLQEVRLTGLFVGAGAAMSTYWFAREELWNSTKSESPKGRRREKPKTDLD